MKLTSVELQSAATTPNKAQRVSQHHSFPPLEADHFFCHPGLSVITDP